ncbi:hypothetical protein OG381_34475 [Streptomyces sp. NBC_00490]|uniref:hypothetical protein n=1 Tax=Streptomyces sp. NBC_00490 TaxID=2903657 RepID=UPI002E198243
MKDLNTDKVILAKVVRRHTFVLGASVALERMHVAVMDDGTTRVITERRPEHFLPDAPRVVTFVSRRVADEEDFRQCVQRIREMEAAYTTQEVAA